MNISNKLLKLGLLPCLVIIISVGTSFYLIYKNNKTVENSISSFIEKQSLITNILGNLGYGNAIHSFKNYILRNDEEYYNKAIQSFTETNKLIEQYLKIENLSQVETKTIIALSIIIDKYLEKLPQIKNLKNKDTALKEIDILVKVDDTNAIQALSNLSNYFQLKQNIELDKIHSFNSNTLIYLFIISLSMIAIASLMSNKMSKDLQHSISHLHRITQDISNEKFNHQTVLGPNKYSKEIASLEKSLIHTSKYVKDKLKSNQNMENYASIVTHDIKAPFARVSSYVNILEEEYKSKLDEDANSLFHKINDSLLFIKDMIDSIYQFNQSTHSKGSFEQVDLNSVTSKVICNLEPLIKESDAQIFINKLPLVIGNKAMLTRLFLNLISNSIKYKKENEPLVIDISSKQINSKQWKVSIQDNGTGFNESKVEEMLLPFKRLDDHKHLAGSGIGLAECDKILKAHNSSFQIKSQENQGACFSFVLTA